MNTIPIICAQESPEIVKNYFDSHPQFANIPYVAGVDKSIQEAFGLKSATMLKHLKAMPKMIPLLTQGYKFEVFVKVVISNTYIQLPNKSVTDPLVEFGLFLVEKGKIIKKWEFKQFGVRPNYGVFLVDVEKEMPCDLSGIEKLQVMFPHMKQMVATQKAQLAQSNHILTLDEILHDKPKRSYFKMFCVNEHSVENILFVEQVEQFKSESNTSKRAHVAAQMVNNFLLESSFMEINVNMALKKRIANHLLEKGPVDALFDDAILELKVTVLSDSFTRFKSSKLFEAALSSAKRKSWLESLGLVVLH